MRVKSLADGLRELRRVVTDPTPRVPFGIPYIDSRTNGGLSIGETAMGMAFSHVGKTALATEMVANNPNVPFLFFSIDQAVDKLAARLLARVTGQSTTQIEADFKSDETPHYVQQALDTFRGLVIDDDPALSMRAADDAFDQATEHLESIGLERPRVVVFDFLERIGGGGLMQAKSEAVDVAATRVSHFTRKHGVSTLLLHQVGKGDAGSGASLLELGAGRYGGHQLMDLVVGMSKPNADPKMDPAKRRALEGQRVLQVLKNRITGQVDEQGEAHDLHPITMQLRPWSQRYDRPVPLWGEDRMDEYRLIGAA